MKKKTTKKKAVVKKLTPFEILQKKKQELTADLDRVKSDLLKLKRSRKEKTLREAVDLFKHTIVPLANKLYEAEHRADADFSYVTQIEPGERSRCTFTIASSNNSSTLVLAKDGTVDLSDLTDLQEEIAATSEDDDE